MPEGAPLLLGLRFPNSGADNGGITSPARVMAAVCEPGHRCDRFCGNAFSFGREWPGLGSQHRCAYWEPENHFESHLCSLKVRQSSGRPVCVPAQQSKNVDSCSPSLLWSLPNSLGKTKQTSANHSSVCFLCAAVSEWPLPTTAGGCPFMAGIV